MANARKVIMRTKVSLFDSVGTLEEETHDDYIASSSIGSTSTNGRWGGNSVNTDISSSQTGNWSSFVESENITWNLNGNISSIEYTNGYKKYWIWYENSHKIKTMIFPYYSKTWYWNGQKKRLTTINGIIKEWYINGKIKLDKFNNQLMEWYRNGNLKLIIYPDNSIVKYYINGFINYIQYPNDDYTIWYKNGRTKMAKINGNLRHWNIYGNEIYL